ncbi:putative RDD family membrane protein YckC [Lipingzhangella halophila]|uniref:Putative RDD family membrane protein YckC n=1 Tax=Lipingzhangella halophila TaxID=1783352 RepID=A0A7W7REM4_9ACTN|nr:RDD family protein [Lipingzhangella halophila]MBB4930546.1 putative RDD family membrane protein YckC [Lipingzhangella halophila]
MPSLPRPLLACRLVALGIDGAVIGGYVAVLFATTMAVYYTTSGGVPDLFSAIGVAGAHGIAFATLTAPVGLYLFGTEATRQATVGKRVAGLVVTSRTGRRAGPGALAVRTIAKLAPWELAHWAVFRTIYYEEYLGHSPPGIVLAALYAANLLLVGYVAAVLLTRGRRGPHDYLARTAVARAAKP